VRPCTTALPSVIERLLGSAASTLRFEEKQWFRYDPATGLACVRSEPALVSPRGDAFKTDLTVYLAWEGGEPVTSVEATISSAHLRLCLPTSSAQLLS